MQEVEAGEPGHSRASQRLRLSIFVILVHGIGASRILLRDLDTQELAPADRGPNTCDIVETQLLVLTDHLFSSQVAGGDLGHKIARL